MSLASSWGIAGPARSQIHVGLGHPRPPEPPVARLARCPRHRPDRSRARVSRGASVWHPRRLRDLRSRCQPDPGHPPPVRPRRASLFGHPVDGGERVAGGAWRAGPGPGAFRISVLRIWLLRSGTRGAAGYRKQAEGGDLRFLGGHRHRFVGRSVLRENPRRVAPKWRPTGHGRLVAGGGKRHERQLRVGRWRRPSRPSRQGSRGSRGDAAGGACRVLRQPAIADRLARRSAWLARVRGRTLRSLDAGTARRRLLPLPAGRPNRQSDLCRTGVTVILERPGLSSLRVRVFGPHTLVGEIGFSWTHRVRQACSPLPMPSCGFSAVANSKI